MREEKEERAVEGLSPDSTGLPPATGTVAVLGLGLIGGSLARELAARGVRVLGYDHDPTALRAALREAVVHVEIGPSLRTIAEAEVVVIAVPVAAAPELLAAALPHLRGARLITDVGSTKRTIVAAAERLGIGDRFVGSHPLAGDHRSGWTASRTGLFAGARVYLCPASSAAAEALELARNFWRSLGANPERMEVEAHDQRLAWASHLPQAASTALARALASAHLDPADLGPGGRGMTRLAGSSPELWTEIMLDNAVALGPALAALEQQIQQLREALEASDAERIHRYLREGQQWSSR